MQKGKPKNLPDGDSVRNQWTPEQRVNAGQLAAEALNSPMINVVHGLLIQKYYKEWQQAERADTRSRERLWDRQAGLTDMLQEMVSMVSEARMIIQEKQNEPAERERQRLDEQGYGLGELG